MTDTTPPRAPDQVTPNELTDMDDERLMRWEPTAERDRLRDLVRSAVARADALAARLADATRERDTWKADRDQWWQTACVAVEQLARETERVADVTEERDRIATQLSATGRALTAAQGEVTTLREALSKVERDDVSITEDPSMVRCLRCWALGTIGALTHRPSCVYSVLAARPAPEGNTP